MESNLVFFQLFEPQSSTYTYILGDQKLGTAMVIDSVRETLDRDLRLIEELDLKLRWALETHVHADHITGAGILRSRTGVAVGIAASAGIASADLLLKDGDIVGEGAYALKVLATPGHTDTCLSFYGAGMVFTGDALLIHGTGRTDFQQGSSATLYDSIHKKLFTLPDSTRVYPAHDYRGFTSSTIGLEKAFNPRVGGGKTRADYIRIMSELKLSLPKRIHEAVPANMNLGETSMTESVSILKPHDSDGIPTVDPQEVHRNLGNDFLVVDVRRAEEFNNELGHIQGARLVTLGPDLMRFLHEADPHQEVVFVCRSGGRSAQATMLSRDAGFTKAANLAGGMLRWNELGFKVSREADIAKC